MLLLVDAAKLWLQGFVTHLPQRYRRLDQHTRPSHCRKPGHREKQIEDQPILSLNFEFFNRTHHNFSPCRQGICSNLIEAQVIAQFERHVIKC